MTNIDDRIAQLEARVAGLERASIKTLEHLVEQEQWTPKWDEMYWSVDGDGTITRDDWRQNHPYDQSMLAMGNVFPAEQAAERHKLRLQSMAKKWKPKMPELYYYVDYYLSIHSDYWGASVIDWNRYHLGRTFRTEEDAQQWIDTYGDAWRSE